MACVDAVDSHRAQYAVCAARSVGRSTHISQRLGDEFTNGTGSRPLDQSTLNHLRQRCERVGVRNRSRRMLAVTIVRAAAATLDLLEIRDGVSQPLRVLLLGFNLIDSVVSTSDARGGSGRDADRLEVKSLTGCNLLAEKMLLMQRGGILQWRSCEWLPLGSGADDSLRSSYRAGRWRRIHTVII